MIEVAAFVAACRFGGTVLAGRAIEVAWEEPSALAQMTVGDVAGHLYLVVRRVDKRLDASAGPDLPQLDSFPVYPRVDADDDLDDDLHRQVRSDGRKVAGWGWGDVVDAYRERVTKLERKLGDGAPATVSLGRGTLSLDAYLASRVLEVVVHTDDLLVSVGDTERRPPDAAMEVAVAYTTRAARRVHGDRAVLDAFTRSERAAPGVPRIF